MLFRHEAVLLISVGSNLLEVQDARKESKLTQEDRFIPTFTESD